MVRYLLILIYCTFLHAYNYQILDPSFSFIFETDSIIVGQDSIGSFEGTLYNLSENEIDLEIARLINFSNTGWSSSICIDAICYNQSIDNISVSLAIGDSIKCGVLAWTNGIGSDYIQLKLIDSYNTNNNMLVNINFLALYAVTIDNDSLNANTIKILSCYPNPFNSSILFKYKIRNRSHASLDIYDAIGQKVKSLFEGVLEAGNHVTKWDGNNGFNKPLPSGVYFLRMQSGEFNMIKKITLIK
tara:strand:- start:32 stop:763 length:732 start_codon:yes stop_codon:yes gene_type:complete